MIFDFLIKEFQNMMQKHSLNTVILLGHLNPDGDAFLPVMACTLYKSKLSAIQSNSVPGGYLDKGPKETRRRQRQSIWTFDKGYHR